MKKLFYISIVGLILFEIANVYFIMPMPGSQRMNSIDVAYFLHTWRWVFRALFGIMLLAAPKPPMGALLGSIVVLAGVVYIANFKMAAIWHGNCEG